jgi:hypothetical protein
LEEKSEAMLELGCLLMDTGYFAKRTLQVAQLTTQTSSNILNGRRPLIYWAIPIGYSSLLLPFLLLLFLFILFLMLLENYRG